MHSIALSLILLATGLQQADTLPERRGLERGDFPSRAPEVQDRLLGPEPAHQDTTGSCEQVLLALAGAPDGSFGAIWMDTRQGNLGLYIGMVAPNGEVRGEEIPAYPSQGTARQLQPDLTFTSASGGMLCWRSGVAPLKPIQVRRFGAAPGFRKAPLGFGAPPHERDLDPRSPAGSVDGGGRRSRGAEPRVAALADEHSIVVWSQESMAHAQRFDGEGEPVGEVQLLDPKGAQATGDVSISSDGATRVLAAWPTASGIRAWVGGEDRGVLVDAGAGTLLDTEHDPRGGWWLLVQPAQGEAVLRHLDARGEPDREDTRLPGSLVSRQNRDGRWSHMDLCVWTHGLALAATGTRDKHPVRVLLLDADGRFEGQEWHPQAKASSLRAKIASNGPDSSALLVAWTDDRHGDRDVFYSLVKAGPKGGLPEAEEARRWNTDEGSAGQSQPAVASNGKRARVAWRDEREGTTRLWMRDLAWSKGRCAWAGDERRVPVGDPDLGGEQNPVLAMAEDGSGLVAWRRARGGAWFVRPLDAEGAAAGPVLELPGLEGEVILEPRDDGYLLSAVTKDKTLTVQALGTDGAPAGDRIVLGSQGRAPIETTAITQLARGRWVVAFTRAGQGVRHIEARFLTRDLQLEDKLVRFDYSGRGGDLEPALAPAKDGGFLMAWTAFDSRGRDVAARRFDKHGEPAERPLGISVQFNEQDNALVERLANGDWVVVWEDDISRWDQIYARRVDPKGREAGPTVTLNGMDVVFTNGRTGPVMAPLGEGFVCAWGDRSRGLGPDVFVTVVGADFDEL